MSQLISVVIPIYKVESYIYRCIDSVLGQTYANLEIILIDDGSPDRCGEICDQYKLVDHRIIVIHKNNGGLSEARNVGILKAKGKYITFLDGDDWVHSEYVEKLYHLLIKTNSNIAICDFVRITDETSNNNISNSRVFEYSNLEALVQLTASLSEQMAISCGKLYEKTLFNSIQFPIGKIHEDEFTTYKLIYKANKVVFTTEKLLYYWQRDDSIMGNRFNLKSRLDIIEAYHERLIFFENIGEVKLANKTIRILFGFYKEVNDNIYLYENDIERDEFYKEFLKLKTLLRKSKQDLLYKIFYESYYILPKIINKLHKAYRLLEYKRIGE